MKLRDYQQRTLDQLYSWFEKNKTGNPCLVLPTGSGKSHIIAALCKEAIQNWPETKVLMLTHVKELIAQNAEKLRQHWPDAPLGIYSAGLGMKHLGEAITFGGIQSLRTKADLIGFVDIAIIDECFVAGTKISTPNGGVDIDKVRCGDVVYNQCGVGIVEAISFKQSDNTYKLELEDGRTIECTGNHPIFTSTGWCAAGELEVGTYLYGQQDLSLLWESVQSLDEIIRNKKDYFSSAGTHMAKAKMLLSSVCEEISTDGFERSSSKQDNPTVERNSAQTYQSRRERAIAAFAAASNFARAGGGLGIRVGNCNESGASERGLPERIQGGCGESGINDSNRDRRRDAWLARAQDARFEKNGILSGSRVVRISHIKRESPVLVFNLQVSGHPSYFANGISAHNCHLISTKDEGGYRTLLGELLEINPKLRVIGLTATPYRLGHGYITQNGGLFDALIEPVKLKELIEGGYLAPLRSKQTDTELSVEGVHQKGGEYIESELQRAVDTEDQNVGVVDEVIARAGERKAWLFFCAGVDHATHIRDVLIRRGIAAACVVGTTPKDEREQILEDFKAGKIRALTNANVLTTGFDYPDIDLLAMLRPTMSEGLYVQMAGRGMRIKTHTDHCLVMDFAGVVAQHGPITEIQPGVKKAGKGEQPVKGCPECHELVGISARYCPVCGYQFPPPKIKKLELRDDDILCLAGYNEMRITDWQWRVHVSQASGKHMLKVSYYGGLSEQAITEYFAITHLGYAGDKAMRELASIAARCGADCKGLGQLSLDEIVKKLNACEAPNVINYKRDGKFHRIIARDWIKEVAYG